MRSLLLTFAIFALGGAACGSGAPAPCDMRDAAVYDVGVDLPLGCPPGEPNEKGVGKACGMCGSECGGGLKCTCDPAFGIQLVGLPCICTFAGLNPEPSVENACTVVPGDLCGTNATCCPYFNAGYYCAPNVCLPEGQCIVFTTAARGGLRTAPHGPPTD
jgi:hypothetical protein